jgi:hypothetical protein
LTLPSLSALPCDAGPPFFVQEHQVTEAEAAAAPPAKGGKGKESLSNDDLARLIVVKPVGGAGGRGWGWAAGARRGAGACTGAPVLPDSLPKRAAAAPHMPGGGGAAPKRPPPPPPPVSPAEPAQPAEAAGG